MWGRAGTQVAGVWHMRGKCGNEGGYREFLNKDLASELKRKRGGTTRGKYFFMGKERGDKEAG